MAQDYALLDTDLYLPVVPGSCPWFHMSPYFPLISSSSNLQDHVLALLGAGFPAWLGLYFLCFGSACDTLWNLLLGDLDLWPRDVSDLNFCPTTVGIDQDFGPGSPLLCLYVLTLSELGHTHAFHYCL